MWSPLESVEMPVDEDHSVHSADQVQELGGVPHGGWISWDNRFRPQSSTEQRTWDHKPRGSRVGVHDGHERGGGLPGRQHVRLLGLRGLDDLLYDVRHGDVLPVLQLGGDPLAVSDLAWPWTASNYKLLTDGPQSLTDCPPITNIIGTWGTLKFSMIFSVSSSSTRVMLPLTGRSWIIRTD